MFFFFFQAEDGIRDVAVTGVQTCALPICTAAVKFTGLLGQNYVDVTFGSSSAPAALDGAVLATTEQPDLSAVMQKIDSVASGVKKFTDSISGDTIDNLLDRKSTRLNSSHGYISYAVFCLKKKKKHAT